MTSEQQAVPVAQFDAGAKALFDDTMAGRFAAPSARPSWRELDEDEKADWRGTVAAIIEAERLTSLPCKSGEGADHVPDVGKLVEFVAMISRMTHTGDDGWTPPSEDDSSDIVDSLIAKARDLRSSTPSEQFAKSSPDAELREAPRKRFKPGKLNERQRSYIILASKLIYGSPVPFCETHVPETGVESYRGLLKRGLMEKTKPGFAKLTSNGWEVASAVHRLCGREREALEIEAWVKSNG